MLVPGILLARLAVRDGDLLESLALALLMGALVPPQVALGAAFLLGTKVTPALAAASLGPFSLLLALAAARRRAPPSGPPRLLRPTRSELAVLLAVALVAALYWAKYNGNNTSIWIECAFTTTRHMTARPFACNADGHFVDVHDRSPSLPDDMTQVIDGERVSLIGKQRVGHAAVLSLFFSHFELLGFRLLFVLEGACLALLGFLVARALFGGIWLPLASMALASLNALVGHVHMLNENVLALAAGYGVLLVALRGRGERSMLALGLLCAALLSVREMAVLMALGLVHLLRWRRASGRERAAVLLGAFLLLGPNMYWNRFAFGDALENPSVLEPGGPYEHTLLGLTFATRRPLSWPFAPLARDPSLPFPPPVLHPLVLLRTFGTALCSLMALGAARLWRARRPLFTSLLFWTLPLLLFLSAQGGWNVDMVTFILIPMSGPVLLATAGLASLAGPGRPRRLAAALAIALALSLGARSLSGRVLPLDPRSTEAYVDVWTPSYPWVDGEREALTSGSLLPAGWGGLGLHLSRTNAVTGYQRPAGYELCHEDLERDAILPCSYWGGDPRVRAAGGGVVFSPNEERFTKRFWANWHSVAVLGESTPPVPNNLLPAVTADFLPPRVKAAEREYLANVVLVKGMDRGMADALSSDLLPRVRQGTPLLVVAGEWLADARWLPLLADVVPVPLPPGPASPGPVELAPRSGISDRVVEGTLTRVEPREGSEVVLRAEDGRPVLVRGPYGNGTAWLLALRPPDAMDEGPMRFMGEVLDLVRGPTLELAVERDGPRLVISVLPKPNPALPPTTTRAFTVAEAPAGMAAPAQPLYLDLPAGTYELEVRALPRAPPELQLGCRPRGAESRLEAAVVLSRRVAWLAEGELPVALVTSEGRALATILLGRPGAA